LEHTSTPSPRSSVTSQKRQDVEQQLTPSVKTQFLDGIDSRSHSRRTSVPVAPDHPRHPQKRPNSIEKGTNFVLQGSALKHNHHSTKVLELPLTQLVVYLFFDFFCFVNT